MTMAEGDQGEGAGLLAAAVGNWKLDPAATTIELRTKAMWGLAKVKAHFKAIEGNAVVGEGGTVSGTIVTDAGSVDTKNTKRDAHLRSGDFFEVEKFPSFTYAVTGARPAAGGKITLNGTFTVRDQTRPLDVLATATENGPDRMTITAETDLDRSQWGLTWAKMGAGLHNHLVITAQFARV
jgi:polyisoprenoid-binding protein YceI